MTFLLDVTRREVLESTLLNLADEVTESLRRHQVLARGVTLKLRDDAFHTITRSCTLADPTDLTDPFFHAARDLYRHAAWSRPVRLIGVTAGPLLPIADRQMSLFDAAQSDKQRKVAGAVDAIRERFGDTAITRARLVKKEEQ